jgi:predicted RNase H-like nuclease (RuvC/YqgF family)
MRLCIVYSKLKAEEKSQEHTRKKLESITKDIENERESLHYRLRSKKSEITQYESPLLCKQAFL